MLKLLQSTAMTNKIIILLILLIPTFSFSQKLKVGVGLIANEDAFNASVVSFENLTIFEGNQKSSDPVILPYLGYEISLSKRFSAHLGIQYYRNFISLVVNNPVPGALNIPESGKIRSVANRNFEVPLELSFVVYQTNQLNWKIRGGLVPVWTSSSSFQMDDVPQGPDWSQQVVDALNAAESIPKSFYMNYQVGLAVEYRKFEFVVFQSFNLDHSISEGYTLYGNTYSFDRRIISTRIGIYYALDLRREVK